MEFIADKYSETCFVIFFLKPTVVAALKQKAPTPENVDLNVRQESWPSLYQQTWRCVRAWSAVCVTRATALGKKKILKTMTAQSILFNLSQTAYNKTWLKMWLSGRFFVSRQNTSLTNPLVTTFCEIQTMKLLRSFKPHFPNYTSQWFYHLTVSQHYVWIAQLL